MYNGKVFFCEQPSGGSGATSVGLDATLTQAGKAADAAAVGQALTTKAGAIIASVSGAASLTATDCAEASVVNMELIGKTEQNGTPTPESPVSIVNAGTWQETIGKYTVEITVSDAEESPQTQQTVTVTSDRPITKWDRLVQKDGQWVWAYQGKTIKLNGSESWVMTGDQSGEYQGFALNSAMISAALENINSYCDRFKYSAGVVKNSQKQTTDAYGIRFIVDTGLLDSVTAAAWKNWLSQHNTEFAYKLSEVEYIPLSASEQAALNALRTYYLTTIVSNDQGCNMSMTYVADTKVYVDNKFAAMQAALANTNAQLL